MDYNWNLDDIYTGFDSDEYHQDLKRVEVLTAKLASDCETWQDCSSPQAALETAISDFSEIYEKIGTLNAYANLRYTVNTNDDEAAGQCEAIENLVTGLTKPDVRFTRFVGGLNELDQLIEASPLLKAHAFYLKRLKARCAHMLSEDEELLIAKLMTTGSSSWDMLHSKLTSKLSVSVAGPEGVKTATLSEARAMAYDADPAVRKAAYEGEIKAYAQIEDAVAAALNSIKGEVITTSERRGFETPLAEALFKTKMSHETLDALIGAMEEYLPQLRRYYLEKAKLMGDPNGLRFYNLFAPVGSATKEYSYEESMDFIIENFRAFSQPLADFATKAYTQNWIDVAPKAGKVGGAYCEEIARNMDSRILLNFMGSLGDLITTAHELGHGYHSEAMKGSAMLNRDVPMPLAETASTFCETIVGRAALKTVSPEEQITVLETALQDAGQCIVDIYSRYRFETSLFERRKSGSLSVEELNELMLKAQDEAYGEALDPECKHPYMWICKGHYYAASLNFYNFPYAFGLLFAKGLYKLYQQEGDAFLAKYDQLLAFTGQETIENICASVGIDVTSRDFWRNSLDVIVEDIDAFIALCQ